MTLQNFIGIQHPELYWHPTLDQQYNNTIWELAILKTFSDSYRGIPNCSPVWLSSRNSAAEVHSENLRLSNSSSPRHLEEITMISKFCGGHPQKKFPSLKFSQLCAYFAALRGLFSRIISTCQLAVSGGNSAAEVHSENFACPSAHWGNYHHLEILLHTSTTRILQSYPQLIICRTEILSFCLRQINSWTEKRQQSIPRILAGRACKVQVYCQTVPDSVYCEISRSYFISYFVKCFKTYYQK